MVMAEAEASYGASAGRADEEVAWLRERGLLGGGRRVLDVGCHTGGLLARMPAEDERIGVDVDARALERAAAAHPGIRFVHSAFESVELGAPVATFTMFHVLEHLPRPVERAAAAGGARGRGRPPRRRGPDRRERREQRRRRRSSARTTRPTSRATGCGARSARQAGRSSSGRSRRTTTAAACSPRPAPARRRPHGDPAASTSAAWRRGARRRPAWTHRRWQWSDAPRCLIWGAGSHTEMLYHAHVVLPGRARARVPARRPRPGEDRRDVARHPDRRAGCGRRDRRAAVVSSYQGQPEIAAEAARARRRADRDACTTRSRFTE